LDEPPGYTISVLSQLSQFFPFETLSYLAIGLLCLLWLGIAIAEAAFFSLSAEDLSKFSQGKTRWEKALMTLTNYPQHVQVTNLFLRTAIKISAITWMIVLVRASAYPWTALLLFIAVVSLLVLLVDLTAKRIGLRHRTWILRHMAYCLKILAFVFMPLSIPLLSIQELVVKILGRRTKASEKAANRILNETLNEVNHAPDENDMVKSMTNFGSISVRQLMRPRKDITAMDIAGDFATLVETINRSGYSRIPAYRSTIDTIEGVIYIKDLIPFVEQQKGFEWQKLIRPAFFVSESARLSVLLKDFQQKHVHIALVLDKYGRVVGLITLQDLIEEVIDDINEEFNSVNP
jgi:putative hemolysin